MTEGFPKPHKFDSGRHIGEIILAIPGLKPTYTRMVERFDPERKIKVVRGDREQVTGNIDEMLPDIAAQLMERNGLQDLVPEVRSGRKRAMYTIAFGSLGIIVAAAAYETIVRDGEDLKSLIHKLDQWVHSPQQSIPDDVAPHEKNKHEKIEALKKRARSIFGHHHSRLDE